MYDGKSLNDSNTIVPKQKKSISGDDGYKHDGGKPMAGILKEFNLSLMEVAKVGTFGAKKYERRSWSTISDAEQRYEDALWRHLLADEDIDPESGLNHLAHIIWNAMALLQLNIRRRLQGEN
jgi:hypothetical protein